MFDFFVRFSILLFYYQLSVSIVLNADRRHLGFSKFLILTVEAIRIIELRHYDKFRRNLSNSLTTAEIWRFFDFSMDCDACVGITHEVHLVVFVTVQNLV